MNKNIISWTHYIYVTITASVLAYVTVMDSSSDDEPEESAISMLPSIDNTPAEPVEAEPVEAVPVESEPVEVEVVEAEPVEAEPVEAEMEVVKVDSVGTSGGKLKKKKTKTNNQNKKVKKTLRRK